MPLSLLVFGRTGQVGSALSALDVPGLSVTALAREDADLTDPAACARAIERTRADVVVNAAAVTDEDADEWTATAVNALTPRAIAEAARARGLPMIQLSTDHVFPGDTAHRWREADTPAPDTVHGISRRLGEQAVIGANPRAVVLRTSWVFGDGGSDFVGTTLTAARSRGRVLAEDDQFGCPTPAADVASAVVWIAWALSVGAGVPGIFHLCGGPAVTRLEFARAIVAAGGAGPALLPVQGGSRSASARPRYSVLDCTRIRQVYGIGQPDWRRALDRVVARLAAEAA